jgi:Xaa-Pro aminopeptidase
MSDDGATYHGDTALDRLLKEAGSRCGAAEVRDLLPGVLAAPDGPDPQAWMGLVVSAPSDALKGQLAALRAEVAAALGTEESEVDHGARLSDLRAELARQGLDGFLVPLADEHQGEYIPGRARRLAWLTGFTGSAGLAVVLAERAAIFVDGRYTLQARDQVDADLFALQHLVDTPPEDWIAEHLPGEARLGYDPWLHTRDQVTRFAKAVGKAGGALAPCTQNPIDAVWHDQPDAPIALVVAHPVAYAGREAADKRRELGPELAKAGADAAVLTLPDSIAWLLNVRGGDVGHTPLALSFAVFHADGKVEWFIDPRKLAPALADHLGPEVSLRPPGDLGPALDALGAAGRKVQADPATAAAWVFDRLEAAGATVVKGADPCQLPKARKNPVELEGSRNAHKRDGVALVRFLAWLDGEAAARGDNEGVSEIEAADRLAAFRAETGELRDLSFGTISASGPNGALPHYRVSEESNRRLGRGELYLVDSGGQYPDGTTDVTRTVAIGAPSAEMRERFTRVLKGHIALATARFPKGTAGTQLDSLARLALWQVGLDFDHGTGHGVGSYLGVHEGPQRISKAPNRTALEPGMIVSNEPGYYKTGEYGIRIENLVAVAASDRPGGEEREMLAFETLTLAPIDRGLVEPGLLSAEETAWLDAYHARVRAELTPALDSETADWLAEATRPLAS